MIAHSNSFTRVECRAAADLHDLPADYFALVGLAVNGGREHQELTSGARALLSESLRVIRPGGLLFVYGERPRNSRHGGSVVAGLRS
jgi:hypothetical protein